MAGDGTETFAGESGVSSGRPDVVSILVQLDDEDPAVQRTAIGRIERLVEEVPQACVPTVSKLRGLLERQAAPCHESVTYCLAELAAESPDDVVPAVDTLVSFANDHIRHPATDHALRAVAHVAEARPDVAFEYVEEIVEIVEGGGADRWTTRLLEAISRRHAEELEPTLPALTDALDHEEPRTRAIAARTIATIAREAEGTIDPAREALLERLEDESVRVRTNAAVALGYGRVVDAEAKLQAMAGEDPNPAVRTRATWALARIT